MKWLDDFRSHCSVWHYFQRRKALRILNHARFYVFGNFPADHILIDAMLKVLGKRGTCSR